MDDHGLAPATREAYGRVSRGYLVFLESRGLRCLDDAEGASVVALASSDEAVGVVCDVITDRRTGPWQGAGQVGVEVSDLVAAGQPYWVGSRRSSVPQTCGVRCSIWVVGLRVDTPRVGRREGTVAAWRQPLAPGLYRVEVAWWGFLPGDPDPDEHPHPRTRAQRVVTVPIWGMVG